MSRIAYVAGRYLPHRRASVHIEDRGYQFADGVYEVIAIHGGRMIDAEPHLDRLDRSLAAVHMPWPIARRALTVILDTIIHRNRIDRSGALYLQVSRGVAPRAHAWSEGLHPTLVVTARITPIPDPDRMARGIAVITDADLRWKRPDIKSIALLPNVLAKQAAHLRGAEEAWLVTEDGTVTEGTSSNSWIVTAAGELVTHSVDRSILAGITRAAIVQLAGDHGVRLRERPFTLAEAWDAREAFATSTTALVRPVVVIDGHTIGKGTAGPLTRKLIGLYLRHIASQCPIGATAPDTESSGGAAQW